MGRKTLNLQHSELCLFNKEVQLMTKNKRNQKDCVGFLVVPWCYGCV